MNKARNQEGFSRTRELRHIYEEVIEQLVSKDEFGSFTEGGSVYADFYHMTPGGATYYVQVEIDDNHGCTECEVWRIPDKPSKKDEYLLGNVTRMLGEWIDGWGITAYVREAEADWKKRWRDPSGLDPAFTSWAEVHSMFI